MKIKYLWSMFIMLPIVLLAQENEHHYQLTIKKESVNITGKEVKAMTVNGSIPGPALEFTEGETAVITVHNTMDVETSVHWHGLILPNFYDGVPYITTPPIQPGDSLVYRFSLQQSGTYWYHSHTGLQEEKGVYGAIVIKPKQLTQQYDKELVLTLSDWTNENPKNQLRNLKRGNEWYQVARGTTQSLYDVLKGKALKEKLKMSWQRMPEMAISDNYYNAFLVNGKPVQEYPDFKPGERVRLRFVNASAATFYWLTFGGGNPTIIAADGQNVTPVAHNKTLIAIAETYDFIVTIPDSGKLEIRAMAQDGTGFSSTYLGEGEVLKAEKLPKQNTVALMKQMFSMDMKMGSRAYKFQPSKDDSIRIKNKYGMKMKGMQMQNDDTMKMQGNMSMNDKMSMKHEHSTMNMQHSDATSMHKGMMSMKYNYDYLKAPQKTSFSKDKPVREMLFNLTGNMWRYVWSINGVPLSETDNIPIKKGEVARITLNNQTMMHHPMHLHGHFFRVINKNGDYSPLKHTVNVPPMSQVTIEFDASETGDWFFHCHVLYHMMSGMARVFHYEDFKRDERMQQYPMYKVTNEGSKYYSWGTVEVASHMTSLNLTSTNIRNQFILNAEYGWNKNLEAEFTYEYFLEDYFRVFGGVNVENEMEGNLEDLETTAKAGIRWLLPMLINSELSLDSKLRPQVAFSAGVRLLPRWTLDGEYEYQVDFGWNGDLPSGITADETVWNVNLEYIASKNISIFGGYDNRFDWGAGLSVRF